eukprot:5776301-Prymnesium_polylepis.1
MVELVARASQRRSSSSESTGVACVRVVVVYSHKPGRSTCGTPRCWCPHAQTRPPSPSAPPR